MFSAFPRKVGLPGGISVSESLVLYRRERLLRKAGREEGRRLGLK
jgi:hypothetical protein